MIKNIKNLKKIHGLENIYNEVVKYNDLYEKESTDQRQDTNELSSLILFGNVKTDEITGVMFDSGIYDLDFCAADVLFKTEYIPFNTFFQCDKPEDILNVFHVVKEKLNQELISSNNKLFLFDNVGHHWLAWYNGNLCMVDGSRDDFTVYFDEDHMVENAEIKYNFCFPSAELRFTMFMNADPTIWDLPHSKKAWKRANNSPAKDILEKINSETVREIYKKASYILDNYEGDIADKNIMNRLYLRKSRFERIVRNDAPDFVVTKEADNIDDLIKRGNL